MRDILLPKRTYHRRELGPIPITRPMILFNGRVAESARDTVADHDGVSVTLYGPGDIIGLTDAILDDDGDSVTLATTSVLSATADVALIRRRDFDDFATSWGGMFAIKRELARRQREALNERSRMSLPTSIRLCLFLLDLVHRFGRPHRRGVELDIPLRQGLIAEALSVSRATVEKALAELRARDLVETGYRSLVLAPGFADETKRLLEPVVS
jgi:CRP-like cAMP-binding protein